MYIKKTIKFVNDTIIAEPYEATEEGQNYLDDMKFKKDEIIEVEITQIDDEKIQVLFVENDKEPFGWIMKEDIEII